VNYDSTDLAHDIDVVTRNILAALAEGLEGEVIAERCHISERTFRRRLQQLRQQWRVDTNIEAVVHAVRAGLI
jgi:DNA-binding NarL/FixJ family response regulator